MITIDSVMKDSVMKYQKKNLVPFCLSIQTIQKTTTTKSLWDLNFLASPTLVIIFGSLGKLPLNANELSPAGCSDLVHRSRNWGHCSHRCLYLQCSPAWAFQVVSSVQIGTLPLTNSAMTSICLSEPYVPPLYKGSNKAMCFAAVWGLTEMWRACNDAWPQDNPPRYHPSPHPHPRHQHP